MNAHLDASDALRLGARVAKDAPVRTIGDLRIQQILAAVGHRNRRHLVDLVVGPLRAQPDWPALRRTIVAWCENGFNLGKIEHATGRSLRDHPATLALYIACLADQLDDPDEVAVPLLALADGGLAETGRPE